MTVSVAPASTRARDRAAALCAAVGFANVYRQPVDAIAVPAAVIVPGSPFEDPQDATFCGNLLVRLDAVLFVGRLDDRSGVDQLCSWSAKLRAAAPAAGFTAGVLDAVGPIRVGGIDYLAAALTLETEERTP